MKIGLIGFYDEGHYGLRRLEASLTEAGHEVDLVFFKAFWDMFHAPSEREFDILTSLVDDIAPDLIGVTVRSPFAWLATEVTRRLEGRAPVLWGGIHATVAPERAIRRPDMILMGEADRSFPLLADRLENGGGLDDVPGLWRKDNGHIRKNPLPSPVEDLDALPELIFKHENRWLIADDKLRVGEPVLSVVPVLYPTMASRGCPHHCAYCVNGALLNLYGPKVKKVRMRDPERVVNEIKRFRETFGAVDNVVFMDEVFGYNADWVRRFCDVWKKELALPFHAEIHPSLVLEEQIARLSDAGMYFMNMGIQSGSERVRREIYHRPVSNEKIVKAANILKRNHVGYRVDLIFGNPLEEPGDLKQTLDLMLALPAPYVTCRMQLTYFPATPITDRFLKEGLITEEDVQGYGEEPTETWEVKFDLAENRPPEYWFYLCLIFIADFRFFYHEPWVYIERPYFYPRPFVRWLERRSWLRKRPAVMIALAKALGKIAHGSYYLLVHYPKLLYRKARTAVRLAKEGNMAGLKAGFISLGRSLSLKTKQ